MRARRETNNIGTRPVTSGPGGRPGLPQHLWTDSHHGGNNHSRPAHTQMSSYTAKAPASVSAFANAGFSQGVFSGNHQNSHGGGWKGSHQHGNSGRNTPPKGFHQNSGGFGSKESRLNDVPSEPSLLVKTILAELATPPTWPLGVYSFQKETENVIRDTDVSPEEMRLRHMEASRDPTLMTEFEADWKKKKREVQDKIEVCRTFAKKLAELPAEKRADKVDDLLLEHIGTGERQTRSKSSEEAMEGAGFSFAKKVDVPPTPTVPNGAGFSFGAPSAAPFPTPETPSGGVKWGSPPSVQAAGFPSFGAPVTTAASTATPMSSGVGFGFGMVNGPPSSLLQPQPQSVFGSSSSVSTLQNGSPAQPQTPEVQKSEGQPSIDYDAAVQQQTRIAAGAIPRAISRFATSSGFHPFISQAGMDLYSKVLKEASKPTSEEAELYAAPRFQAGKIPSTPPTGDMII